MRFLCGIYLNAYIWQCIVAMASPFLCADPNKNVLDQRDDSEWWWGRAGWQCSTRGMNIEIGKHTVHAAPA